MPSSASFSLSFSGISSPVPTDMAHLPAPTRMQGGNNDHAFLFGLRISDYNFAVTLACLGLKGPADLQGLPNSLPHRVVLALLPDPLQALQAALVKAEHNTLGFGHGKSSPWVSSPTAFKAYNGYHFMSRCNIRYVTRFVRGAWICSGCGVFPTAFSLLLARRRARQTAARITSKRPASHQNGDRRSKSPHPGAGP